MLQIEKQYLISKILNVIEKENDKASALYFKSNLEFNPSENNFNRGYMQACTTIRESIIELYLKEK